MPTIEKTLTAPEAAYTRQGYARCPKCGHPLRMLRTAGEHTFTTFIACGVCDSRREYHSGLRESPCDMPDFYGHIMSWYTAHISHSSLILSAAQSR